MTLKPNRAQSPQQSLNVRSTSNNSINNHSNNILRSQSHETSMSMVETLTSTQMPKISQSETSLESIQLVTVPSKQKLLRDQPSVALEEDICSTDSSTVDEEVKKRRRKLFPGFSKKNKSKVTD